LEPRARRLFLEGKNPLAAFRLQTAEAKCCNPPNGTETGPIFQLPAGRLRRFFHMTIGTKSSIPAGLILSKPQALPYNKSLIPNQNESKRTASN
jgi:hypothetical protein